MKTKKIKSLFVALLLLACFAVLTSCMQTGNSYTKAEVDSLISSFKEELSKDKNDCEAEIEELRAEYEAKIAELEELRAEYEAKISDLKSENKVFVDELDTLTANYNAKVAELEAADKANADAFVELDNKYRAEVDELKAIDAANTQALAKVEADYKAAVAELEKSDKANADALAALDTAYKAEIKRLESLDQANADAIARVEEDYKAAVAELEKSDKANADALAALEATDNATKAEIEKLIEEYNNKLDGILGTHEYTVSFDLNGGDGAVPSQTVKEGKKVTRPTRPTREDYVFLGWYVGDEKWSFIGDTVTEDITLSAKWASSKILSVADNCTLEGNTLTVLVKYPGEYVDIRSKITYDESCSISLYKNSNLTSEYSHCRMTELLPGENKAYLLIEYDADEYAIYDVFVYAIETLSFMSEGNLFASVAPSDSLTVTAPEENPISAYAGYEFSHWAVDGAEVSFPYTVTQNTVFEAVYKPTVYTLTYVVGNGIMPESYTTEYTVESGAVLPIPARSLYLFDGWFASSDFSGEAISEIPLGEYGNKTYYAKWTSATDGVTYSLASDSSYYTVTGYEGSDTEIVIPDTLDGIPVKAIASSAFKGKQRITAITVSSSVTSIGYEAFSGCISLVSLNLGSGITYIPSSMAYGCTKLESIEIPNSVTSIGYTAFEDCDSLTSVYITDIAAWCNISFYNSSSNPLYYANNLYLNGELVTELVIPDSVTSIGSSAFSGCDSLTSVVIGESVESIGDSAFFGCSSLTSVVIGESVESIGDSAFSDCYSLTSVYITDIAAWCNISFYNSSSNPLYYANNLYLNGELVTELVIPDSVTSIGDRAFYNCYRLTSVVIPDSVTSIGNSAFSYCSSLYVVYNNSDLLFEIGSTNNGYVAYYAKVLIDHGTVSYKNDGYEYILTDEGFLFDYDGSNYRLIAYTGGKETVTLPSDINGNNYEIYSMRSGVVNVIIPDGVTSIGSSAFSYCSKLTSVVIPDSVTSIGDSAFYHCYSLTSVVIPDSVTSIGDSAFSGCYSLTSITANENNTVYKSIDGNLYSKDGTELVQYAIGKVDASFTIPDSVTSIGDSAFSGCDSLTSVVIPDSVTIIGDSAFFGCSSLTSVVIPDSVTSIGDSAFSGCDSLTSVVIPDSVTIIGSSAFYGCDNLTIYCEATSKPYGWDWYWNYPGLPVVWGYTAEE